jgi:hypothetical protein
MILVARRRSLRGAVRSQRGLMTFMRELLWLAEFGAGS